MARERRIRCSTELCNTESESEIDASFCHSLVLQNIVKEEIKQKHGAVSDHIFFFSLEYLVDDDIRVRH